MRKLFGFVGMTAVSWFGWWLGAFINIWVALLLSTIGTGFGLYYGRKLHDYFMD